MVLDNLGSLQHFLPEFALTATALLLVIVHVAGKERTSSSAAILSLVGVGAALVLSATSAPGNGSGLFEGMVATDGFATFFKVLTSLTTLFVILMSVQSRELCRRSQAEYYLFLVAVLLGIFCLVSATDLVMLYVAFELVSIPAYLLAGYLKGEKKSTEAAMKYVIYGGTASGVMIYGFSLLFGIAGSTHFSEIARALASGSVPLLPLALSVVLITAGFGYKIAAVPFHMWSPDVYEGAPTPITAFLSVGPKAAGFAVLIRFFYSTFASQDVATGLWKATAAVDWPMLFAVLSAVTMTVGNLVAIKQDNVKRMLAYSSIAHAGYMLMGFVVLSPAGVQAILFYLVTYLFMNLGAFYIVLLVSNRTGSEEIQTYQGMGNRSPFLAVAFALFLFSLTGLPPFAGFIGKVYLFAAVVEKGVYWLAILAALNSAVSLYYYARIVKTMFLEKTDDTTGFPVSPLASALILIFMVPTLVLGVYWEPIIRMAAEASTKLTSF